MSNIKYVIRHNDFAYNDEWYQTDWITQGSIHTIYSDKNEAEQAYKQLIVEALYNVEGIGQYSIGNGDLSDTEYQALDDFLLEKTGHNFEYFADDDVFPALNLDDAFKLAQLSGIVHYQLLEIDDSKPNYVIWLNNEQSYFSNYDSGAIVSGNYEDFIQYDTCDWHFFDQISTTLKGTLSELSDSPEILEKLLEDAKGIQYSVENQTLDINGNHSNYDTLKALNALLKQPIFEIRQVTLEELAQL